MPLNITDISVRECFIPRPGYAFLDADIEALELCTLGQVEIWTIKDDTKAKQLNAGLDPHCLTGMVEAGLPYEEFYRRAKGVDPKTGARCAVDKNAKNMRNMAKVPNFGKPGGMADTTLVSFARTSYGIKLGATPDNPKPSREVAEAAARRIGRFWKQANPNDQLYLDYMRSTRGRDGMYHVIIGHPSIGSVVRRGRATYCAACNSPFQGLGALAAGEITFEIQMRSYWRKESALYGSRLVIHAYDQWVLETPIERITEAAAELGTVIAMAGARKVPDVRLKAVPAASLTWNKAAETVYSKDGRLLIWGTPECAERYEELQQEAA